MNQEKRPTCVTVIGWAWIIIGGLMCLSAIMSLISLKMYLSHFPPEHEVRTAYKSPLLALLTVVEVGFALLGLISGINFLKLKSWARNVLEVLTWLWLLLVGGLGMLRVFLWVYDWVSKSGDGQPAFDFVGAVWGITIFAIYIIPLAIMVDYLRGDKVKNAMIGTTESVISFEQLGS